MAAAIRLVALLALLSGCTGLAGAALGTLGGPNVAANVQAGAENEQGINTDVSRTVSINRPKARDINQEVNETRADSIGTVIEGLTWWQVLLIGIFIPGPTEWILISRSLRSKRKQR